MTDISDSPQFDEPSRRLEVAPFSSIVVPIDFSDVGDRAIAVAATLARRAGLPVDVISTISPGLRKERDAAELLARAQEMTGCVVDLRLVESDDKPDVALAPWIAGCARPLLCLGTHGRTAIGEAVFGSVTQALLSRVGVPAIVVGPRVDATAVPDHLLVCIDPGGAHDALLAVASAWHLTFKGTLEVLEVVSETAAEHGAPAELTVATRVLAPTVVAAPLGHDPVRSILDAVGERPAIPAVGSHLHHGLDRVVHGSVAWELIRATTVPVLVQPVAERSG
jgi:nucleotide-binding universal stress UspA family protein